MMTSGIFWDLEGKIYLTPILLLMPQCHSPFRSFESLRHFRSEVGSEKADCFASGDAPLGFLDW